MEKVNIPYSAKCPNAACSRSNTCARHAYYLEALKAKDYFEVMNLGRLVPDGAPCPYHLTAQKQRCSGLHPSLCLYPSRQRTLFLHVHSLYQAPLL